MPDVPDLDASKIAAGLIPKPGRTRAIGTAEINHPCPADACTETLVGTVKLTTRLAATQNEAGGVVLNVRPQFPVDWSQSTLDHIAEHNA